MRCVWGGCTTHHPHTHTHTQRNTLITMYAKKKNHIQCSTSHSPPHQRHERVFWGSIHEGWHVRGCCYGDVHQLLILQQWLSESFIKTGSKKLCTCIKSHPPAGFSHLPQGEQIFFFVVLFCFKIWGFRVPTRKPRPVQAAWCARQ